MKTHARTFSAVLITLSLASLGHADSATKPAEPTISLEDWTDSARDRTFPVKVYLPASTDTKWPVIFLSHGLGGSREAMTYLGEHWSRAGYLVITLQHPGSDESVWRDVKPAERIASAQKAANGENYIARAKDVTFAIDHLTELAASDARFKDHVDLDHIGVAGHSFGAQTVQAIVGQRAGRLTMRDDRVKAGIAFSPGVPARTNAAQAFDQVDVPIFHFTGTKDQAPLIRDLTPAERRIPYDNIIHNDQYLLIFKDGDHAVFGGGDGRRMRAAGRGDTSFYPLYHQLIADASLHFWNAYLRGDVDAKKSLESFDKTLGENGTFERKSNP